MNRLKRYGLGLLALPIIILASTVLASLPVKTASAQAGCTFAYLTQPVPAGDEQYGVYAGRDFLFVNINDASGQQCNIHDAQVTRLKMSLEPDEFGLGDDVTAIFDHATVGGRLLVVRNNNFANPEFYYRETAVSTPVITRVTASSASVAQNFIEDNQDTDFEEPPAGQPGDTDTDDQEVLEGEESCESSGALGWIGCPIVNILSGALNTLDSQIQRLLEVDRNAYSSSGLRAAWTVIRNIAYALLIPAMLIMVIGTALGFEVFSAYTVKKALPRMIIAIIFITFSWYICGFLINMANVVGGGVLGIMTAPFGTSQEGNSIVGDLNLGTLFDADIEDGSAAASAIAQWGGLLGGLAILGPALVLVEGFLGILLLYLGTALLFVAAAFLVLILRQMFIIVLLLLAPIAILAWIFPGNDKPWKLWWSSFSKLLIMFPLIMAIIAAGRIFAYTINITDAGGIQGAINAIIKLSAYILPYVFIPFTFKFAGGLFANLAGMVNDREKGLFDRMKKKRGEEFGKIKERGGRNALIDQEKAAGTKGLRGRWMRGINKAGGWGFDPMNSAHIALGTQKGKSVMAQINQGKLESTQKLSELLGRMGFNAEELSALSIGREGKNSDGSKFHIGAWNGTGADLERIAKQLESSVDEQDRIGAGHLRANAPLLLQAYKSEEFGRADIKAAAGMAYASQGFATPDEIARLANEADGYSYEAEAVYGDKDNPTKITGYKYNQVQKGMATGFGGAIKTNAELLSARGGGLGKPGYTVRVAADGSFYAPSGIAERDEAGNIKPESIEGAKIEQVIRYGVGEIQQSKGSQFSKQLGDTYEYIMTADPNANWTDASGDPNRKISEVKAGVEETLVGVLNSYAAADVKKRAGEILAKAKTQKYLKEGVEEPIIDENGRRTGSQRRTFSTKKEAEAYAEREVNSLSRRGGGIFDVNEIEQQRQQEQNEQNK